METHEDSKVHPAVWLATAVGAGIGIAAVAYRRRPRTSWDRAVDGASDLFQTVRQEVKPWMGAAAGTAAAGTAAALYLRRPKESAWQRTGKRAAEIASHARTQATRPWASLAATAAVSLASIVYANQARRRAVRGIDASTAKKINNLTEKGMRVLHQVRNMSGQTAKLYARGRRAIA